MNFLKDSFVASNFWSVRIDLNVPPLRWLSPGKMTHARVHDKFEANKDAASSSIMQSLQEKKNRTYRTTPGML